MPQSVIYIEHLSKQYDLGVIGTGTISRDLNRWWARVQKKTDPYSKIGISDYGNRIGESILALDDVSFTVKQGEVLGIIGRNGAGKSTLLKILSQVTAPTSGKVKIKGRIGSLLEVGTGFHPELTGRENVYLNGAILGMSRAEVDRKFDEIVEFSGVEKYIDTPVKRYSSGMHVRLGFAVAAHLDPEILIVDEVLAVGDAEFQKKCLGKMGDVAHEGRTVLFVSHNMAAISRLCDRAILLNNGHLTDDGPVSITIRDYLHLSTPTSSTSLEDCEGRQGNGRLQFTSFHCENEDGTPMMHLTSGQTARFVVSFKTLPNEIIKNLEISIVVYSDSGYKLTNFSSYYFPDRDLIIKQTNTQFVCEVPRFPFRTGAYLVELYCSSNGEVLDWIKDVQGFEVTDGDYFGLGKITNSTQGKLFVNHRWLIR